MQYLIGIGLVTLGIIAGFGFSSFLMSGAAEEMARQHLNEILGSLKRGEIKIEDIEHMI
jgi:hypothetical protein